VLRADLERVGRFDEAFTGYGHEDLELGYACSSGISIEYAPEAVNYHWHRCLRSAARRMELAPLTVRLRKHPTFTCVCAWA